MGEAAVNKQPEFDRAVLEPLAKLGRRLRVYAMLGGLGAMLLFILIAATSQLILDLTFRLPTDMRLALLLTILGGAAYLFYKRFWLPMHVPIRLRDMASLVERRHGGLNSTLVSAVQFATGDLGSSESNSPELAQTVVDKAIREAKNIRYNDVLRHAKARQSIMTVIAVLGLAVGTFALEPEMMGLWFERNILLSDTPWPRQTHLTVDAENGILTAARGDDLEIRASARGVTPRQVDIVFESESEGRGRESMIGVGLQNFRYTFKRVEQEFRFQLRGGDDITRWYEVHLADRPRVEQVSITVTPPAYTGIAPHTLLSGERSAEAIIGSKVTIDIHLNKAAVYANLMAGQEQIATAQAQIAAAENDDRYEEGSDGEGSDRGGRDWTVTISPDETRTYHFSLEDEIGLANKRPVRIAVRVLKDSPPRVSMKVLGAGDLITAAAIFPLELSFTDTYGLASAELSYQIVRKESTPVVESLDGFTPGMKVFDTTRSWPVATAGVVPGSRLTLFAQARDFNDISDQAGNSGPGESQSAIANFRVVTTDELLAELARREQEYRQEFERVIEEQEDLRGKLLTLIGRLDDDHGGRESGGGESGGDSGGDKNGGGESGAGKIGGSKNGGNRTKNDISTMERRQRQIAGQVNMLRQQFERILQEYSVNGLDTKEVTERLGRMVIAPMTRLAKRDLVSAADVLREFARNPVSATANRADAAQMAVLSEMRRILSNMLKWEGYQEAVTMLREILRLQNELNRETQEEVERQASDIFDDD